MDTYMIVYMQTYVSIYICIYMCENKLQCIICSDIHMSHNDNSRNVSHTFLIDHNLSGPGRSHAQAAKQHLLLISRPPARWATGFSGDLQHNYLLLYIMFCFCNVCTIVLEINILLLLLQRDSPHKGTVMHRVFPCHYAIMKFDAIWSRMDETITKFNMC